MMIYADDANLADSDDTARMSPGRIEPRQNCV